MIDFSLLPDGGTRWLDGSGDHPEVVLSTRVRLARNVEGFAFTTRARDGERLRVLGQLRDAMPKVDALKDERATYVRQAALLRAEADSLVFERDPGDVQFDEESGEGDTIAVERERDLTLSAQALAAVDDIDLALEKIKEGTYGVCEQCNNIIPKERLRALPYAALCVQCKSAGFSRR